MSNKLPLVLGAMFLLLSQSGYSGLTDEDALALLYGSEDFVSIATGRKQPVAKAPAVASVITAKEIIEIGARSLMEVLEGTPGLHVSREAGGYDPIITIRGIYSDFNPQVLMLVNGVPITNLLFGNRGEAWGSMPIESISRVEVIRGPGSAVYGADAFAGTINIITKKANEIDGLEIGGSIGSFNTNRGWVLFGGRVGSWDAVFSLEALGSNGHHEKIDMDVQTIFDGITGTSASFAPAGVNTGVDLIDVRGEVSRGYWEVRAGYQGRRNVETGAGASQALDPIGKGQSDKINFDITYVNPNLTNNWEVKVQASYFDVSTEIDLVLFPPGAFDTLFPGGFPDGVIGQPDVYERHYRFDTSAFYTGIIGNDLRIGAGYHYLDQYRIEEIKNYEIQIFMGQPIPLPSLTGLTDVGHTAPFNREEVREVSYLFIQDEWKFLRDWSLTAGVRYDHYSDFGDTVNPRFALVWDTANNLTTKLLYGRAFRAPSFAEQFNINNPIAIGNDDLDPEIINTYELAFDYTPSSSLRMGLNVFYYEMQDIIRFTPVAENTGDQTGHGLEWEFEWTVNDELTIRGNYALQDSTDEDTDGDAPNAPQQQLYLRADYDLTPSWSLNAQLNHVMDRKRAVGDLRPEVDDYTIIDLTLIGRELLRGVDVTFSVRNLADEDAFEPSLAPGLIPNDLPLAGRSVFAEIRKSW